MAPAFLLYRMYVGPHDGCERSLIMSTANMSSIYGCMFRLFGEFCDSAHACTVLSGMPYRAANSACVSPDIARTVAKLQSCSSVQVSTSSPGSMSGKRLRNSVRLGTRSSSARQMWNCAIVMCYTSSRLMILMPLTHCVPITRALLASL